MSVVTHWELLTQTSDAWERLIVSCERATHSIAIEQYILGVDGPIVARLTELLMQKAREGVRVRLLLDAVGSFFFFHSSLPERMRGAGVEIIFHRTILPPSWKRFIPLLLRDHRKLAIIDEKEAHIGGIIYHEKARFWRDTTVVVEGSIVTDFVKAFSMALSRTRTWSPLGRVLTAGAGDFYLAGNSFRLRDKLLYRSMVRAITRAKKNVLITTPYFSLPRELRRALWRARSNGAEVCMLLPKRSDIFLADVLSRFYYKLLMRRGVKIFHYTKSILHAKSISVDGAWATVGSCNLDWLSIWVNYELNLVGENPAFAQAIEKIFWDDVANGEPVSPRSRGWYGLFY